MKKIKHRNPDGSIVDVIIGSDVKIGFNVRIGSDVTIGSNVWINSHVSIDSNVTIGSNVWIYSEVRICSDVTIGSNVWIYSEVRICSDVRIGSNVWIYSEVRIGSEIWINYNLKILRSPMTFYTGIKTAYEYDIDKIRIGCIKLTTDEWRARKKWIDHNEDQVKKILNWLDEVEEFRKDNPFCEVNDGT